MSETSLNAKCGIEGFSFFQPFFAHDLKYWWPFSPLICPNEIDILELEQLNHQMTISI